MQVFLTILLKILILGAVHMDETLYLFKRPAFAPMFKSTDPENTIIEQLTRLLYTFALTG